MIIEIYKGKDGQFYWRSRAKNGKIRCNGEGHPSKAKAIRAAKGTIDDFLNTFGTAVVDAYVAANRVTYTEDDGSVTIRGL